MVSPTCFGITLPSLGSVPSAFWVMLNWGAVDRRMSCLHSLKNNISFNIQNIEDEDITLSRNVGIWLLGDVTLYPWLTECWFARSDNTSKLALKISCNNDWSLLLSMNSLAMHMFLKTTVFPCSSVVTPQVWSSFLNACKGNQVLLVTCNIYCYSGNVIKKTCPSNNIWVGTVC
jgi:hypothetical protein